MQLKTWVAPVTLLFSLATVLTLLIALVAGVSGLSASQVPLSFNTCALPCVMGIIPGQTSYSHALRIIESTIPPEQIIDNGYFWINDVDGTRIEITVHGTGDFILSIELLAYPEGDVTSLGNLFAAGYTPQRVFRARGLDIVSLAIILGENEQVIGIISATGSVNPFSPVERLIISGQIVDDHNLYTISPLIQYYYEISWLGFAPIESYLDA